MGRTASEADVNVGLFANERESNLSSTVPMVESVLQGLGHVVDRCRIDSPGAERAWRVRKGSAEIGISIIDEDGAWQLRIASAVMTIADEVDQRALFERLLALNADEIHGAAFAIRGPHVMLLTQRTTRDLDLSEVEDSVRRVQDYADDWDDKLVEEFGGTLGAPD